MHGFAGRSRPDARQADPTGGCPGKLLSPARRRRCIDHIRTMMPVSERRLCRVLGQHRSTQRKALRGADDKAALTEDIIALARQHGRYGYRRVTALLRDAGWHVNRKRVERIWRREGLKVPQRQPKRGRLWLNDGSCMPGVAGRTQAQERRRAGGSRRAVRHAWAAGAYTVGQWPGVYSDGGAAMARPDRREDALYHAGEPRGEWVLRELQRVASR